jgi:uncharacterized protein (TIGR02145 family)
MLSQKYKKTDIRFVITVLFFLVIISPLLAFAQDETKTYYLQSGAKYVGDMQNGTPSGYGTIYYKSGDKYTGGWKEGMLSGKGTYFFASGEKYEGDFKDGVRDGSGTLFYLNGDKYVGEWKNDSRSGKATYFFSNGDKYIGEWIDNELSNEGFIYCPSGTRQLLGKNGKIQFSGYFKDGKKNGEGILYNENAKIIFKGNYKNDSKDGQGTQFLENGDTLYSGLFNQDYKQGTGTYFYPNGEKYTGGWIHDKRWGKGIYYFSNGDKYIGDWLNDLPTGFGTYFHNSGKEETGYFENGKYCGNKRAEWDTVTIAGQTWMADNYARYSDDGCYTYENDLQNMAKYGCLYTPMSAFVNCPEGWHLPTIEEINKIIQSFGSKMTPEYYTNAEGEEVLIRYKIDGIFPQLVNLLKPQAGGFHWSSEDSVNAINRIGRYWLYGNPGYDHWFLEINFEKRSVELQLVDLFLENLFASVRYIKNQETSSQYWNLGWYSYEWGDIDKAIEYSKKSIELNPKAGMVYGNLGLFYLVEGDLETANDYYSQALKIIQLNEDGEAKENFRAIINDLKTHQEENEVVFEGASDILLKLRFALSEQKRHGMWKTSSNTDCKFFNEPWPGFKTFTWTGNCKDGYCDGEGLLTAYKANGSISFTCEGFFTHGEASGYNIVQYDDGYRYEGDILHSMCHGVGKSFIDNELKYFGSFKYDKKDGFGTYYFNNGEKYIGEFKSGFFCGYGELYSSDERLYKFGYYDSDTLNAGISINTATGLDNLAFEKTNKIGTYAGDETIDSLEQFKHLITLIQSEKNKGLISSIKDNKLLLANKFLMVGADANSCDENGVNAILWATYSSGLKMVELLKDYGATIESKGVIYPDSSGAWYNGLLVTSALKSRFDLLRFYIEICNLQVDQPAKKEDKTGWTALQIAAYAGNYDIAEYLIKKGASVENNIEHDSPLLIALRYRKSMVASTLLNSGARFNVRDKWGNTPLHYIAQNNDSVCYELISEKITANEIDSPNQDGNTAVHLAVIGDSDYMLKKLREKGANIGIKNNNDFLPIDYAIFSCSYAKYLYLNNRKANDLTYDISDKELIRVVEKMKRLAEGKESGLNMSKKTYVRKFLFKIIKKWDSAPETLREVESTNDPERVNYLYNEFTSIVDKISSEKNQ